MTMAALGGSVGFDTLDDHRDLAIAAGTQTGAVIPLKGLGVPKLRGRGRGDLFVHVQVDTPDRARRRASGSCWPRWPRPGARTWARRPRAEGLFSKLRSALS